jgi:hypothetical protein
LVLTAIARSRLNGFGQRCWVNNAAPGECAEECWSNNGPHIRVDSRSKKPISNDSAYRAPRSAPIGLTYSRGRWLPQRQWVDLERKRVFPLRADTLQGWSSLRSTRRSFQPASGSSADHASGNHDFTIDPIMAQP